LTAALKANFQLFAGLIETSFGRPTWMGGFSQGTPISGLAFWLADVNIIQGLITGSFMSIDFIRALASTAFMVIFSTIFAVLWVKTSGMDASSQARNILSSGLQIPGFRRDERVLESILERYVTSLTVMGGAAVGLLASIADILGALVNGTAILLAIMITYQFYQNIAQQHAVDMHPALKKMMG